MKVLSKILLSASLLCAVSLLASCASKSAVIDTKDLWVTVTKDDVKDCGFFYTTPELVRITMVEAELKKEQGSEQSGFGLAFGYSSQKNGIMSNYIRFEINALGEYAIYSWNGSKFSDLVNEDAEGTAYLTEHPAINKGLGATNKLKVEKTTDGTFNCYINGTRLATGIEPFPDSKDGVMAYFSVGKEEEENLPDEPVIFSYRISDFKFATDTPTRSVKDSSTAEAK